jgi:hypothetical protein
LATTNKNKRIPTTKVQSPKPHQKREKPVLSSMFSLLIGGMKIMVLNVGPRLKWKEKKGE